MKFLRRFSLIVGLIVLAFVGRTAFLSNEYSFTRSIQINENPEEIFPLLADLKLWKEWNPWLQLDSSLILSYSDKTVGEGAYYLWASEESGKGKVEIVVASAFSYLKYEVKIEGWEDIPSIGTFSLNSVSDSLTEVSWTFAGTTGDGFFLRWLAYMMEGRVAPLFESGLDQLKLEAEEN